MKALQLELADDVQPGANKQLKQASPAAAWQEEPTMKTGQLAKNSQAEKFPALLSDNTSTSDELQCDFL